MASECYACGRDTSKFPASKFITCSSCGKFVCFKCQDRYKKELCKSCLRDATTTDRPKKRR